MKYQSREIIRRVLNINLAILRLCENWHSISRLQDFTSFDSKISYHWKDHRFFRPNRPCNRQISVISTVIILPQRHQRIGIPYSILCARKYRFIYLKIETQGAPMYRNHDRDNMIMFFWYSCLYCPGHLRPLLLIWFNFNPSIDK